MTAQRALRLGFAGTPEFAVPALDALARSGHELVAVFTKEDRAAGRGRQPRSSAVKAHALELGLDVLQPSTFKDPDACALLEALRLDILVVVAYGLILPRRALDAARLGCLNIHASLLPRWRGAAPVQRALLAGDHATGVTIMRMEETLDTGPMLAVRRVEIDSRDTAGALHDRLAVAGALLLGETLEAVAQGSAQALAQPREGITYAEKITKAEALVDWREDAQAVARRVRAFNPTPVAETRWEGTQLRIWDAVPVACGEGGPASEPGQVLAAAAEGIQVACGRGALRITRLQLAGRKPLAAEEFLRANRLEGARFAST